MFFMPPGGSVLEIRPDGDKVNNAYYSLANCMNLNYYYLFSNFENSSGHLNKYDLKIDIARLAETVTLMLDKAN